MAATLPLIATQAGKLPKSAQYENKKRTKPVSQPVVAVRQMMNRKEIELQERRLAARAKLPELTEWQTNQYQNTYKQTLCVAMLQNGFHQSFREIFGLIKQQSDARIRAGPDSNLWNQQPLIEEHEKLDTMKQHLVEAETALLLDDYNRVYHCHRELAEYFNRTGDKWLSDHFFQNCLKFSMKVEAGSGKIAAQGHRDVGRSLEEAGSIFEASRHFEKCYELSKGNSEWLSEDGSTAMHSESCKNLARIYTSISVQCKADGDNDLCLTYLTNAYEKAKEGGDRHLYGEACYQLGMAYINNNKPDIALNHFQSFLDTCQLLKDSEGVGKACEAIAKAHDSQGHVEESIKYLQKFVNVAEESKEDKSLCDACNNLGIRFNCLGKYSQSFDNSSRAYNIARTLNDTTRLRVSRVLTGISHGHEMLDNYSKHVMNPSLRTCVARILDWKDNRGDEFDKQIIQPQETDSKAEPSSADKADDDAALSDSEDVNLELLGEEQTEPVEEQQPEN